MSLNISLRALARSPGYTVVALATLALGIGVNTSMFSVVETLLFRDGPFPHAEEIAQLVAATPHGQSRTFSVVEMREIRARVTSFTSLTTVHFTNFALTEPGQPAERMRAIQASADFFATFGVQPMLGRAFTEEETLPGRNNVIVLSHGLWQQRFGGDPNILGRTLRLDGQTVTVIGVMPESFDYRMLWGDAQFWRPINFTKDQIEWRDYRTFSLIGRLKPGVAVTQAASELAPVAATQEKEYPESYAGLRYRVLALHDALIDTLGRNISWMLLGLSAFVLLIACANLANLQLARATAGVRDLAIRSALGASRWRLIRLQLGESLLLALGGGAIGLGFAWALNQILGRNALVGGAAGLDIRIDAPILLITVGVALLTGVVFGIVPAWLASRTDMNAALKAQSRGSTAGRGSHLLRQALIVFEVMLALVLLGGAATMQQGFAHLLDRETGWDTTRLLTAGLPVPETRFVNDAQRNELYRKLEARLKQLPGVEHAALATSLPIFNYTGERQILTEGQSPGAPGQLPNAYHVMVTPDYFATLGIPLVAGRLFDADISVKSPRVIVVNEALAQQVWPGESALGKRLGSMDSGKAYWAEVIGVVRDVESAASLAPPSTRYTVYKPLVHEPWSWVALVVRSPAPETLIDAVRKAVAEVDPDLPADGIGTVRQTVDRNQHNLRLAGKILVGFAALGLLLAAVGIYGVISNVVAQRTTEFGIRLALGARPRDVLTLVLRHGMALSLIGLGIGTGGAYLLARYLGAIMPRLAQPDPFVLFGVATLLLFVALFACYMPARRATKVDPLDALRAE